MACQIAHRYMGGSVLLNGTTSTIPTTLTSNDVFKTGNGFTMWRWINANSYGATAGKIFDKSSGTTGQNGFDYTITSSKTIFLRINNASSVASSVNSIQFKKWTLALVTVANDGTVTHYINGVASGTAGATGALSGITTANPLTIGNRSTATDRTFDGLLGEGGICPRVLTQAEITALYTGEQPVPSGTAHFWKLDEVTGVFVDIIGGATGTGTATSYSTDVPVQLRTAIDEDARSSVSFDGDGDYITLATPITAGSIAFEVNMRDIASREFFYNATSGKSIKTTAAGLWQTYDTADRASTLAARLNRWDKMVFVYNGTGYDIYRNGQHVATIATSEQIAIELISRNSAGAINGWLKNVRMWSQATQLTKAQIIDLHFNNIVPTTGLALNYTMNEGAGPIVYDQSGNGNNGTVTGATWSAELPSAPRVQIGGNMVPNGDFSYVPPEGTISTSGGQVIGTTQNTGTYGVAPSEAKKLFKWRVDMYIVTSPKAYWDYSNLYEGHPTMRLSGIAVKERINATLSQRNYPDSNNAVDIRTNLIPVLPNTEYTLTFPFKQTISNGVGTPGVYGSFVGIYAHSSNAYVGQFLATEDGTGNAKFATTEPDWRIISKTFTTGASTRYLNICAFISGNSINYADIDVNFGKILLLPTTPVTNVPLSAEPVAITCT